MLSVLANMLLRKFLIPVFDTVQDQKKLTTVPPAVCTSNKQMMIDLDDDDESLIYSY